MRIYDLDFNYVELPEKPTHSPDSLSSREQPEWCGATLDLWQDLYENQANSNSDL